MSGTILLVRHGETNWKFRGRLQGLAPTPLNEHGREQSKMLADYFSREYDDIAGIYTSNLRRSKETAVIIHMAFDERPDLVVEETLKEVNWGIWQGMQLDYILDQYPEFDFNENGERVLDVSPKNGESLNEAKQRLMPYWKRFRQMVGESDNDHPHIVVTHSQPINAIMSDVTNRSYYDLSRNYSHEPIEVAEIKINNEGDVVSHQEPSPPWNTV